MPSHEFELEGEFEQESELEGELEGEFEGEFETEGESEAFLKHIRRLAKRAIHSSRPSLRRRFPPTDLSPHR